MATRMHGKRVSLRVSYASVLFSSLHHWRTAHLHAEAGLAEGRRGGDVVAGEGQVDQRGAAQQRGGLGAAHHDLRDAFFRVLGFKPKL
jgi:hypothetical protein